LGRAPHTQRKKKGAEKTRGATRAASPCSWGRGGDRGCRDAWGKAGLIREGDQVVNGPSTRLNSAAKGKEGGDIRGGWGVVGHILDKVE